MDDEVQAPQGQPAESTPEPTDSGEPQLTQQDTSPEPQRLYAGKFKSPDDLERAYQEAERRMHEATRETAAERRARMEAEQRRNQPSPEEMRAQMQQAYENDPVGFTMQYGQTLTQQMQQIVGETMKVERATQTFMRDNPDLSDPESEQLVAYCVSNFTDPTDTYRNRLDKAGKLAREYLQKKFTEYAKRQGEKETRLKEVVTEPATTQRPTTGEEDDKEPSRDDYFASRREVYNRAFRR